MNTFTISIYRANTSTLISLKVLRHFQLFFEVLRFRLLCVHFLIKIVQPIGKQRVPGVIQLLSESTYIQTHTDTPTRTHTHRRNHTLCGHLVCVCRKVGNAFCNALPLFFLSLSLCVCELFICACVLFVCVCVRFCHSSKIHKMRFVVAPACCCLLLWHLLLFLFQFCLFFSVCVCIFASFLRLPGFFTVGFAVCLISNSF